MAKDTKPAPAPPADTTGNQKANKSRTKKRRLGRGLSSLIQTPVEITPPIAQTKPDQQTVAVVASASPPAPVTPAPTEPGVPAADDNTRAIIDLDVTRVDVSRYQPRQAIDPVTLEELAASIRSAGVMQPILVIRREADDGGGGERYELVAGERRWRAAQLAGLGTVPAIVAQLTDQEAAEWAVIENIQREDLAPLEQARAFEMLVGRFGLRHDEIAQRVGLDRSSVTNFLRLLELEPQILTYLEDAKLTVGHCKALLMYPAGPDRVRYAERAVKSGWSVRKTERLVATGCMDGYENYEAGIIKSPHPKQHERPASLDDLEKQLAEHLGTKVHVKTDKTFKKGRIVIDFYDLDQFDGLMDRFGFSMQG